jgi:hypothetical protein
MADSNANARGRLYADLHGISIEKSLGYGSDGTVWKTSRTALKVFHSSRIFTVELECYRRLQEAGVTEIYGFAVPQLAAHHDELLALEMSLVNPPYVLDFGKVTLDRRPDYPPATLAYVRAEQQEWWGELYPTIQAICADSNRSESTTPTQNLGTSCPKTGIRTSANERTSIAQ